ncbi:hypothetical protein OR392_000955 [Salmonella enterica subsp. enterica serovar Anatum]|nr:hypothetical protein [Salmonella enterica subsp. enterica serovar Anatum]
MNAFTVAESWLIVIGALLLSAVIARLPLLIKDYRHKRRQKEKPEIIFLSADKYKTRDGDIIPIWDKTTKP